MERVINIIGMLLIFMPAAAFFASVAVSLGFQLNQFSGIVYALFAGAYLSASLFLVGYGKWS